MANNLQVTGTPGPTVSVSLPTDPPISQGFYVARLVKANNTFQDYATAQDAHGAASGDGSETLMLSGYQTTGLDVNKSFRLVYAHGAVFTAGVVLGFNTGGNVITGRWVGGTFLNRLTCARGTVRHQWVFQGVAANGSGAYLEFYALSSSGSGRDKWEFHDSLFTKVSFQGRGDSVHQQGAYFLNCQVGTDLTTGAPFVGYAHPQFLLTLRYCTVRVPSGSPCMAITDVGSTPQAILLKGDAQCNVDLPPVQPNLILDGWRTQAGVDPWTVPGSGEYRYPSPGSGGTPPNAPTNGVVDDTANTFTYTPATY